MPSKPPVYRRPGTGDKQPRRSHRPEHRALYALSAWQQLRKSILLRDNYTCQWVGCGRSLTGKGNQPTAPVAHHKVDHKGDMKLFLDPDNIISICKECHDMAAQRASHRGYVSGHDEDGRPARPEPSMEQQQSARVKVCQRHQEAKRQSGGPKVGKPLSMRADYPIES